MCCIGRLRIAMQRKSGGIEGQKFSLHYDFGGDWMFAIRVMEIEEVKRHHKPKLLSAKGSVEQYPEGEWEE